MAFYSEHAPRIWDDLYTAMVPDQVTLNTEYLRVFGTYSSGHKEVDRMMESSTTTVKIPIIKMVEYFDLGVYVQIPRRESMLTIHRNIELYLGEWRHHLEHAIHTSLVQHKDLILSLEKFSRMIYGKAYPQEVVSNPVLGASMGLLSPMAVSQLESTPLHKPDYSPIAGLIRKKVRQSRY